MSSDPSPPLRRVLGFWDSVAINVGAVIGVGIFSVPHVVARDLASPGEILLAWALGGLLTLVGVLCYAELSSLLPRTGGTYAYLREAFGEWAAFLFGWMELAIARGASIAAMAYIFADYLQVLAGLGHVWDRGLAAAAILFFTVLNGGGVRFGARVQNLLSLVKVACLAAMAGAVLLLVRPAAPVPDFFRELRFGFLAGMAPAMIPILWTYGGWHQSTFMSGEFRDTRAALPLSLIAGVLLVTALYLAVNAAYLAVLSPAEMGGAKAVASEVFGRLFGENGRRMIAAAVVISAGGALNAMILTGGRIPYAMACDYPRLGWFAKVDEKHGTPLRSLALNSFWACGLLFWGDFEQLLYFSGFAVWLFFALAGTSVFVFRTRMKAAPPFSLPGYPLVPLVFILSSYWLCLVTIRHTPRESLFGALVLLAGVPIHYFLRRKKS